MGLWLVVVVVGGCVVNAGGVCMFVCFVGCVVCVCVMVVVGGDCDGCGGNDNVGCGYYVCGWWFCWFVVWALLCDYTYISLIVLLCG